MSWCWHVYVLKGWERCIVPYDNLAEMLKQSLHVGLLLLCYLIRGPARLVLHHAEPMPGQE